ncbi:hypothetical protein BN990_04227 [Virgibacillus salexigens]|uniref:Uncharacterized protein n=1 Tax=Virgibacillus massiliensis TaxID=1462526 RepID=A0A024QH03_9BACI|nr:hypothetical protein BN990_04227 [Virgibacillus massiliensis]
MKNLLIKFVQQDATDKKIQLVFVGMLAFLFFALTH